ncbi:MAG TPA: DUF2782 domain-containing protein [Xanthomonadaceae bacterium]|nr:DUF2782 domain-containing protein [Xanthomonadaceae bacterium]
MGEREVRVRAPTPIKHVRSGWIRLAAGTLRIAAKRSSRDLSPPMEGNHMIRAVLPLVAMTMAACAALPDPTMALMDPQIRTRIVGGDVIAEYVERGRPARIVKITPADAAPFYLFDDDGDDRIDRHLGIVSGRYQSALVHRMPFEDYGLVGLPPPPRRPCDHDRQPVPSVICP